MFTVLILIYILQGGLVGTHTVLAPSFQQCVSNAPAIIAQEAARGAVLGPDGVTHKIVKVVGQCVEVPGPGTV